MTYYIELDRIDFQGSEMIVCTLAGVVTVLNPSGAICKNDDTVRAVLSHFAPLS